jgi:hypothetical protein
MPRVKELTWQWKKGKTWGKVGISKIFYPIHHGNNNLMERMFSRVRLCNGIEFISCFAVCLTN